MKGFDNLFDNKFTSLDLVKIALLVASFFSTWNIVDLITPNVTFAIVRIVAFVTVVEGAFVAFERATRGAKNVSQTRLATIGFFCSLTVITLFLLISGFLEFAGPSLLDTQLGTWAGITWAVRDVVMIFVLVVTAAWVFTLAFIARLFALADPDKQAELQSRQLDGDVQTEANNALRQALDTAKPEIAIQRALLKIDRDYGSELTPSQLAQMKVQVEARLREHYSGKGSTPPPAAPTVPANPSPVVRPVRPVPLVIPAQPMMSGNGNGNGHHPTT